MAWAPDYCTVEELSEFARISGTADEDVLARAISAASRAVDQATGRQFGLVAAPEARYYTASWDSGRRQWAAPIDDLMTITGLEVAYDSAADGSFVDTLTATQLGPRNAAQRGEPWTRLVVLGTSLVAAGPERDGLRVTARWGWSAVPPAIVEATLLQASRLAVRRDSPYGIAGTGDQTPGLRMLNRLDPDVDVAVRPYRRGWWAA